ncbi:MAG: hypothetical protein JKY81_10215 [Colwellia sp.]|nr:hypothetical protein [Colwellia sp.]
MQLINKLFDQRINAHNLLFEISIDEYLQISHAILNKNEFQRRRVKSSSTVYNLLRKDLEIGCIIPPLVLALSDDSIDSSLEDPEKILEQKTDRLIILDGLQRTYTIRDVFNEITNSGDGERLDSFKKIKIRIEIYIGINKLGILYRMLTLNTGQTAMSMRHQIEILYSDYLDVEFEGITLILEAENRANKKFGEYKFKEVIEGFTSYLDRNYLPMNRNDLLENIESLEKLSNMNQESDIFKDYLRAFHGFLKHLVNISNDWQFNSDVYEQITGGTKPLSGQPFASSPEKIFAKSQVMTGFGSAIGKLVDFEDFSNIGDVIPLISKVKLDKSDETYIKLISMLDQIKTMAKKIGNDQRLFFHFIFRSLFDKKSDGYLNLDKAISEAFTDYLRKTS